MKLTLYEQFTRRQVHDLFDPTSQFTPQAGSWGLWGIVPIPGKIGDYVFFVTFGIEQAGHHFDEWVSRDGVINWQSQPRQGLADRQIQQFLHHDPTNNNIYLFLRTKHTDPYSYLGQLAYHAHDPKRERPVYIQWQILDWNPPLAHLEAIGLTFRVEEPQPATQSVGTTSFEWRGSRYEIQLDDLYARIREVILSGLPAEATRYRDWYVELDGQRISTKWIFHLITDAEYNEFDGPTARYKLQQIGITSIYASVVDYRTQPKSFHTFDKASNIVREAQMARNYIYSTISQLKKFFIDLILLGEIRHDKLGKYYLNDSHKLDILESGLVCSNPFSWVASPRLLSMLPIADIKEFESKLSIDEWEYGWRNFPERAFRLENAQIFSQLNYDYANTPKQETFYEDNICRPVFLYQYLPSEDWEDWSIDKFLKLHRLYTEPKLFVHSTLPIQNTYGGLVEFQDAVWRAAFYWLMMQLIILSDTETGVVYDPQISVYLSEGWRDSSAARLFLRGECIGELADCLPNLMASFKWVWVNRSDSASENNQACLGLLRLLLKIEIAELAKDGRLIFNDAYRRQLFENQAKARLHYLHSKEARDKLRETIKGLAG